MNKIYNSPFEVSLRFLILLDAVDGNIMTVDRIVNFDFIATYGLYFDMADMNLHGDNNFSFSELAARRSSAQLALKQLVLDRMLQVKNSNRGFSYGITEAGKEMSKTLNTQYSELYREQAYKVISELGGKTNSEITKLIDEKSRMALERR